MMFVLTGVSITFQSGSANLQLYAIPIVGGIAPGFEQVANISGKVPLVNSFDDFDVSCGGYRPRLPQLYQVWTYMYMTGGNKGRLSSLVSLSTIRDLGLHPIWILGDPWWLSLGARLGSGKKSTGAPYLMDAVPAPISVIPS